MTMLIISIFCLIIHIFMPIYKIIKPEEIYTWIAIMNVLLIPIGCLNIYNWGKCFLRVNK